VREEIRFTLPDGRTLAYAEFGQSSGHPVLDFHGSPSSRLEPLMRLLALSGWCRADRTVRHSR